MKEEFFNLIKDSNVKKTENKSEICEENEEETEEEEVEVEKAKQLFFEYELLSKLEHSNIIKVYGFYLGNKKYPPAILMEYCESNLEKAIKKLNDIDLVGIIYEICIAMKYLHDNKVIHRDLKMMNILIDNKNHVKICDFGISRIIDMSTLTSLTHGVGTFAFMAPEMFDEKSKYDEKVDVYSFGVVMYFILTKGKMPPFAGTGSYASLELPQTINPLSQSIIKKCWLLSPQERLNFRDILDLIINNNFMLINGIEKELPKLQEHLGLN